MHWSQIRYRGNRRVLVRRKRDSFDNFGTRGRYITTWVHQSPHRYTQMHSNPIRIRGIGSLSLSFSPTIPFARHSSNFANDSALIMHRARSCKFVILSFLFFLLPLYRLSLLLLSFSSLSPCSTKVDIDTRDSSWKFCKRKRKKQATRSHLR